MKKSGNDGFRQFLLGMFYLLGILGVLASGGGGGDGDDASNTSTASITFPAQAQNISLVAGVPRDFTTVNTFDVKALGGPFESVTIDAQQALASLTAAVMRPAPAGMKLAAAKPVATIAADMPASDSDCYPFGIGPLGNPDITDPWGPFAGFVYQNVPPFALQPGDVLAFDLSSLNDVDIGLDIEMAATTVNGGNIPATAFTHIVSNTQTPANPRGDTVIGNFELGFTVDYTFDFPGGGLIIRFSNPSADFNNDITCTQVLVSGDSGDSNDYFVERFLRGSDILTDAIGTFQIRDSTLTTAATVEIYTGLGEEQDGLCDAGGGYQPLSIFVNGLNQVDSVQPARFVASQALLDIYNSGSVATCTRVTSNVDAVVSMSGLEAEYQSCTQAPADFNGVWSGTYSCTGSCPDPGGPITLTVNQNGDEATYSDGSANYSGFVCGDTFSFRGGNPSYDESGKLLLTGANSATKTSFFRESSTCSGSCTDFLTRQ